MTALRVVDTNKKANPEHATVITVEARAVNYADERTDKRPSEAYHVRHTGGDIVFEFHEGKHPAEGLNGMLLVDVLAICLDRLEHHQQGPFACEENKVAAIKVKQALTALHFRTQTRETRGVSGTQNV